MRRSLLLVAAIILTFNAFAGFIKGTVSDAKNNSPLTGVVIYYKAADTVNGSKGGTVTDIDGKYELSLKEGDYTLNFTYSSYTTETITLRIAGKMKDSILDVKMKELVAELKSVEIKAKKITNTEMAVISEIRASNSVVSGTSSSQISKSMDRNAADVVKRIPGVSIQDDRFVVIRGLPDRYNTVWLNDAGAPSSEADKKSFSFDIIPSGLIDRVLIFKTPSPELPGDFAGGMVKVYTTTLQDKNQLSVNLQTSSRSGTTGRDFKYNEPSKTDWLGYDDGGRSIPAGTPDFINKTDTAQDPVKVTKAFKNDWIVKTRTASPDMRFAMSYTGGWKYKKIKFGNTVGITYSNTKTGYTAHRQDWDSTITRFYDYYDATYVNNVSVGVVENVGVSIGNSRIEFKNLYSQVGKSTLIVRNAYNDTNEATLQTPLLGYAMGYDSKATYSTQLSGSHKTSDDSRKYNWTFGYNDVFKNQPNLRRIKYTKSDLGFDTIFKAPVASLVDPNFGGGRYYAELYEKTYSFNHGFSQKVNLKNYSFTVNAGNYIEKKRRAMTVRKLGYTINPIGRNGPHADSLKKLPINEIFADTNVGTKNNFVIDEGTDPSDRYTAKNDLFATYVSVNAPIGKHLNVIAGARNENNVQSIYTFVGLAAVDKAYKTNFWLPSVNLTYNFNEKSLVRGAVGKTLNRPEFREFAPVVYYDFEDVNLVKGSLQQSNSNRDGLDLKVAEINNYDLRYEFYPSAGEMIHVGAFYKTINNAILRVIDNGTSGDNKTLTYLNGNTAYCAGVEFDMRKNLVFADNLLGTKFFKNLSFVGNLALSKSESKIDTTVKHFQVPMTTLQGQSPYLINMGLYYQHDKMGLKGSLLYNTFGARLYAIGTVDRGGENIGEMPFRSLDLTVSKLFKKHYLLNVGIQNLLDSKILFYKDIDRNGKFEKKAVDNLYRTYSPGRYYTIGVKVNF